MEIKYNNNDLFSKEIWEITYKFDNENDYKDTVERLVKAIDDKKYENDYYSILIEKKFVPGGRIISNLGANYKNSTLMNCFTYNYAKLYNDSDSINGIFSTLNHSAKILSSEGGLGLNFSFIRPSGSLVSKSVLHPGVISYMELWNKTAEIITKGYPKPRGKNIEFFKSKPRKGALMGILEIWHPDIIDFINSKTKSNNQLYHFNISVGITDDFMNALLNDDYFCLEFPDYEFEKYDKEWDGNLYNWKKKNYPTLIYEKIKAKDLWDLIMKATYTRNDPGVIFIDKINKLNPLSYVEDIRQTNPCGEQPLGDADSCNLGAINLVKFYKNNSFDYNDFIKTVQLAIRFLDLVLDKTSFPLESIKENTLNKRRIGLGIMGLGSLFHLFNYQYGSKESIELTEKIMKTKAETEYLTSALLGKEKGSFRLFDKDLYFNTYFWKNFPIDNVVKKEIERIGFMRNSHKSTIAPTGNTSILADIVSGGIEPVFLNQYKRTYILPTSEFETYKDIIPKNYEENEYFKYKVFGDKKYLCYQINENEELLLTEQGLKKSVVIYDYGYLYNPNPNLKTAMELSIEDHISILNVCSKYVDSAISKTINLPNQISYEDFKDIYLNIYKSQYIKGATTYRDGTMPPVLSSINEKPKSIGDLFRQYQNKVIPNIEVKLPDEFVSECFKFRDNGFKFYVFLSFDKTFLERPIAIFLKSNAKETRKLNKVIEQLEHLAFDSGIERQFIEKTIEKYYDQPILDKLGRILGLLLRHNVNIIEIIKTIQQFNPTIHSILYYIVKVLLKYTKGDYFENCPTCNSKLIVEEGCIKCKNCGYSKC